MVAVAKVPSAGAQVTVPVYPVPAVTVVTGVAPATGGVTPAMVVAAMVVAVAGNNALEITPELAVLVAPVDPAMVNWLAVTPLKVYPAVGLRVMVAV